MAKFIWRFVSCVALLVMLGGSAAAQTVTGTIQGTVSDTSGGVLPGVTVVIKNMDTGGERTVVTNEAGLYNAPFIQIGRYTVTATLASFGTVAREGIQVGLNAASVVDFTLDPRVTDTVTVTGDATPINLTRSEVKSSLTSEQIMDKPTLNAGNFLSLAETFPGLQQNPTGGQNNPTASSGSSINFNNTGTRGATFQINGVNNDDSSENQNRQGVALSTIAEFQILKNGYSSEFGRGDGAVVLVQTKSGTNSLKGDAYVYRQDSNWNARSWFAAPGSAKPNRQRTQYGVTAGFPVMQNKLFGFVNVDLTKLDGENGYTRELILPSDLNVPWLTRGNDTPENRAFIQSVLDRFPAVTPNDPRGPRIYTGVAGINWPDYDYSGRLDWNVKDGQTLTGRYQWTHQLRENEEAIVGEQTIQDNTQQNLGVTWTHMFNNVLVGEARYGLGIRSTNVNIKQGNDTPIIRFAPLTVPGAGAIIGNAGNFPINRDQTDQQFVYNLTAQLFDKHSFKAGADVRRQALDDVADNFSRGFWNFNRVCGGTTYPSPYAALVDGCVVNFQRGYGPFFLENRMNEANIYAQDDWRISDAVTLNLGLRYEYVSAPSEKEDRIDYVFGADKDNIEPRVGIAYAPNWESGLLRTISGGPGGIAFHAGYGIYDGRIFQSVFSQGGANVRFNPPNALYRTLTTFPANLNVADPTLGFVFTPGPQVGRVSVTRPSPDLEMPSTQKWNVSMERLMPWNSTLKVTYQGNYNNKRLKYALGNLPQSPLRGPITVVNHPNNAPTGTFPDLRGQVINAVAADAQCAGTGFFNIAPTAACPVAVPIANNEISALVPRTNERRPDPLYTTNLLISNDAESWYDGVEFSWDKRLTHGMQFQVAYTYSNSEDTTSEATFVGAGDSNQQGPNSRYARAKSRFHTPHRFTFNGSYRLPFFANNTGVAGQAFGGWMLSGVVRVISGTPFTVTATGVDIDFDGFLESRPVLLDPSVVGARIDDRATAQAMLPRAAFRGVTFGDTIDDLVPRNAFYADGLRNVDLALSKIFRLPWSGDDLSVRIEGFNVFNQVQFGFPVTDINSPTFGALNTLATSYSPRVVQLVMRYRY
ncbi:MAG: TonB-dependent receptor [Acidobacteria bacterium]|nr:TonB-dependent receptor [Acidobacteriota bacterium]